MYKSSECLSCGHIFETDETIHPCRGCGRSLCSQCMDICEQCRQEEEPEKVIVTRHPALVEYLVKHGVVPEKTKVLTHVSPEEIKGKHVYGVLPMHLAAVAQKITEIPLALRPEHRGKELSLEEMEEIAGEPQTYVVSKQ